MPMTKQQSGDDRKSPTNSAGRSPQSGSTTFRWNFGQKTEQGVQKPANDPASPPFFPIFPKELPGK